MITTSINSEKKIRLGIDCESLNKSRWGVARIVFKLLEQYSINPEWQKKYKLYLYFQTTLPSDPILSNPLFNIRVVRPLYINSFNIYYHILMPLRALSDKLDWIFFPSYMLPPLYFKKSIVLLTGDVHRKNTKGTLSFRYRLAYELFSKWASIAATKILTISNASKNDVINLFGTNPSKVFISRLGVGNSKFEILNPKQIQNSKLKTHNYILFVGQALPRRRLKETILAFEKILRQDSGQVAPEFPDLKLIAVGTDKYNPPIIKKMVSEINKKIGGERIIHYDYIKKDEELKELYQNAALFIYVSTSEAFGLPNLEAAAQGIPVVVKNNNLNHELFEDAAFFVDNEKSSDDIAKAIRDGLNNHEKRIYCERKYKEIIPRFNWYNFALNFFNEIK
jgi:glycosyltransferase involved in cell wall biosynthesis